MAAMIKRKTDENEIKQENKIKINSRLQQEIK